MFSEQKNVRILVIEDDAGIKNMLADEVIKNTPFEAASYNDIAASLNDICVPGAQDGFNLCLFSYAQAADDNFEFMKKLKMPVFMLIDEALCGRDISIAIDNGACGFIIKGGNFLKQFHKYLKIFLGAEAAKMHETTNHSAGRGAGGETNATVSVDFCDKLIGNVQHSINNLLLPVLLNISKIELYFEKGRSDELKNEIKPLLQLCESNIGVVTELISYMKELTADYDKNKMQLSNSDIKQIIKAYIDKLITK